MNKKQVTVVWIISICLCPLIANAMTFDDMLMHRSSDKQPFLGDSYKNIKWVGHTPTDGEPSEVEANFRGQIDVGLVDLDGDSKPETIKVVWGPGVSDHGLTIELYRDSKMKELITRIEPGGVQPNFKVEDIDSDGKLEVVLWGAVSDPNMSQDVSDETKPFEGHSDPHLFQVDVYKIGEDNRRLQKSYISKQKYEPFCEDQPI